MKTILILTHTTDDTASMVIDHLNTMDCRPIRFNTDKFHKEIKTNLKMSEKGKFNCYFKFNDGLILPFEEVSITWNRRIHNPDIERIFSQEELNNWLEDEVQWGMNISFTLLNCPIVNPWEVNERLKFNKMYQMKIAANLGLEVPKSLITNLDSEITIFWSEIKRNMIFKKIKKGLFNFKNGKRFILHTNKIDPEKFDKNFIDRMKFTPVFLQEHIHKKYDIRSIVIDDSVYSFAIHSQETLWLLLTIEPLASSVT